MASRILLGLPQISNSFPYSTKTNLSYSPKKPKELHSPITRRSPKAFKRAKVLSSLPKVRAVSSTPNNGLLNWPNLKTTQLSNQACQPETPKKCKSTQRIYWAKRNTFKPVLIINFEGVLGDHFRLSWSKEQPKTLIRKGVRLAFGKLKEEFLIVLVLSYQEKTSFEVLNMFIKKVGYLDAAYVRESKETPKFRQDYSQIYEDFNIFNCEIPDKVLLVTSLQIDMFEVKQRQGEALIYEKSASSNKRYICNFAPSLSAKYSCSPVTLLVSHFQMATVFSFAKVSKLIFELHSKESFFKGLASVQAHKILKLPIPQQNTNLPPIMPSPSKLDSPSIYFVVFECNPTEQLQPPRVIRPLTRFN